MVCSRRTFLQRSAALASLVAAPLPFSLARATGVGFNAHKNYVSQSGWTPFAYNLISWPTIQYNSGNRFDGRWFVPVQNGEPDALVQFCGQIWLQANAPVYGGNYVGKLFKNGAGLRAPIFAVGSFPNTGVITMTAQDKATAGDYYEWQFYTTYSSTVMDGDPAHTFFSAAKIS